jgi:hypothetical protein
VDCWAERKVYWADAGWRPIVGWAVREKAGNALGRGRDAARAYGAVAGGTLRLGEMKRKGGVRGVGGPHRLTKAAGVGLGVEVAGRALGEAVLGGSAAAGRREPSEEGGLGEAGGPTERTERRRCKAARKSSSRKGGAERKWGGGGVGGGRSDRDRSDWG